MAKHIRRKLTASQRAQVRKARVALDSEKPALVAQGRRVFERQGRLRDTVRALKAEREAQGVSLTELAKRTGMTKATLSRLENDPSPNPTIATLSRIAEALGRQIRIDLEPAA